MNKQNIKKAGVLLAACLLVAALALLAIAGLRAKYVTTVDLTGAVHFTADLAVDVTLLEHKAERNSDGSYKLHTTETVATNTYVVMPGVDIPKDPTITITTKSAIPAYLYVEVVGEPPTEVSYAMKSCWQKLSISGRKVYVYQDSGSYDLTDANGDGIIELEILENNKIIVSDKFDPASGSFNINFSAYLIQISNDSGGNNELPETLFEQYYGTP